MFEPDISWIRVKNITTSTNLLRDGNIHAYTEIRADQQEKMDASRGHYDIVLRLGYNMLEFSETATF